MFYIIYQITNNITGKRYIGKHQTKNLDDCYMGSGIILKRAFKKHGIENFTKEILFVFDNEPDMVAKEIELITEDIVKSEQFYNVALGGTGGKIILFKEHPDYTKTIEKISLAQKKRGKEISIRAKSLHKDKRIGMYGKTQSEKQKQTVSKALRGIKKTPQHIEKQRKSLLKYTASKEYINPMKGKCHTTKSKEKMCVAKSKIPKILCKCGKLVDPGNYKRWHKQKCL